MAIFRRLLPLLVTAFTAVGAGFQESDLYLVQSEFGDSVSCDLLAQGIFLVWWDNRNDLSQEAAMLLDSMANYRELCLGSFGLQDPPNPQDGFYFNVYLHEQGDVFPDGWSCGVGTDSYGYPYMTLPIGVLNNWVTISHESFHVFQYSSDAPGFEGDDCFWFIEASANWFAAITHPGHPDAFVEAMSLVKVPHVAMWLGYDNFPVYYPDNWQRYVHQYAMALFLWYLTEVAGLPDSLICGGFYNTGSFPQNLNPQEYLFEAPCVGDLRTHFMNWAARMSNDFDFILPSQLETAMLHWNTYADPEDDNQFTWVFGGEGFGGWYSPPESLATTPWSFNVYKILNAEDGAYSFDLQGSPVGTMGDSACFRGKVVVRNAYSETRFYDLEMQSDILGSLTVNVSEADTVLYFIVGSLPETFSGCEEVFPYMISVEPALASADPSDTAHGFSLGAASPNPFRNWTSMEFNLPVQGLVLLEVFNVAGRSVATLAADELPAGHHQVSWNGTSGSGGRLPSGLYVARLLFNGDCISRRLTLLR